MRHALLITVAVGFAAAASALPVASAHPSPSQKADSTIVELAVGTDSLSTLVAAVKAAGLVETLAGDGPFTVFAPTNEAFAKLPKGAVERLLRPENKDALVRLLTYHVVPGRLDAASALSEKELVTAAGPTLAIQLRDGRFKINESNVVANDIAASNGVVHVIDSVLLPPEREPVGSNAALTNLFVLAIDRGAPLFNDGNTAACAAIYEVAIRSVVALSTEIDGDLRGRLAAALDKASREHSPRSQAWTLRGAMDEALEMWARAPAAENSRRAASASPAQRDTQPVFEFDRVTDDIRWFTVNDDVMGGISKAKFVFNGDGTVTFKGALSLENNGGFATVRSPGRDLELDGYDGLIMRVRGDGRQYGLSALPSDRRYEINTWRTNFQTRAGEWQEIRVPFTDLVHQVMGRRLPQTGPLAPNKIRSIALSVSDKNETPFELEIDWIRAYRESSPTSL